MLSLLLNFSAESPSHKWPVMQSFGDFFVACLDKFFLTNFLVSSELIHLNVHIMLK